MYVAISFGLNWFLGFYLVRVDTSSSDTAEQQGEGDHIVHTKQRDRNTPVGERSRSL